MHTRIRRGGEPGQRLRVELFQVPKGQARPEIAPHLFHAVLDFALRLRTIREASLVEQIRPPRQNPESAASNARHRQHHA